MARQEHASAVTAATIAELRAFGVGGDASDEPDDITPTGFCGSGPVTRGFPTVSLAVS